MLITVISTEYEPHIIGGLGIVATRLAEALAARGHEIVVLTKGTKPYIEEFSKRHLRIFRYPRDSEYFSKQTQTFYANPILHHLRKLGICPDIIHVHSVQGDALAKALSEKFGAQTLYTCHSLISEEGLETRFSQQMEHRQRQLIEHAHAIISPSRWQALLLMSQYPTANGKTYVVSNGTNIDPNPHIWHERTLSHLLFVGRLIRSKCVLETIHAVASLKKVDRKVKLDIIGRGSKEYTTLLHRETDRLHLTQTVRFHGSVPHHEVISRMQRAGIVVVPSRSESFGLVALEAMGNAIALASTTSGGLADFVSKETASIIHHTTASDIAHAIQEVWGNSSKTLHRRYAAYATAKQYTWEQCAKRYEEVINHQQDAFTLSFENEGTNK
ncbi:glycosyltransferase family 4 protein [Sulfoacidibacillus thermotolerans]|uniref:Glycosyl transferase family 1 n=1 Tax=Sulfoacidibacillus thermotolerans TaxID=1765684 RepID=A0A2U3D7A7_SULT2|nr:glycosyltransferase family 4 protein [Sulfoacidibacillus thermotolerans]PWI57164.1 hypothetical protein BM613_09840 [Sulfoacidibacillus thermotolerans]